VINALAAPRTSASPADLICRRDAGQEREGLGIGELAAHLSRENLSVLYRQFLDLPAGLGARMLNGSARKASTAPETVE
jgi:hypothetical protein